MCLPSDAKGSTIQSIATIVGALLCLNAGMMFGISPSHAQLYQQRDKTPLNRPIDDAAATWVLSYLFLGAAFGALFSGIISNRIGPKSVLLLSGLLQITGWFCIHFGFDIIHIYASRLFAGIAAGAAFTVLPIFITEITDDSSDRLIVYIEQARSLGILAGLILGYYVPYLYVSVIGVGASFVFSLTFPFVQESPHYYLRKANMPCFEKSLRWFRGIRSIDDRDNPEFIREVNALKVAQSNQEISITKYKSQHYMLKLFILCLITALCAQFTGAYVILSYPLEFLPKNQNQIGILNSNADAICILAAAHFVGSLLATYICRKMNRKVPFLLSGVICAFALVLLALFMMFATTMQLAANQLYWLTLALLSLNLVFSNVALFPLATIIAVELLPPKVRSVLTSIIFSICWLLGFLLIHYYHSLVLCLSLPGCCWFFAATTLMLIILYLMFVPESRHKSSDELKYHLGYGQNDIVPKISTITNGHMTSDYI